MEAEENDEDESDKELDQIVKNQEAHQSSDIEKQKEKFLINSLLESAKIDEKSISEVSYSVLFN